MRSIIVFAILALAIAGVVPRLYADMNGTTAAAAKVEPAAIETAAANSRSLSISRGDNGHFNVEAVIDGRRMELMVDTGASVIALRQGDAARLGIHPAERDYTAKVSTANGIVSAARVELNRVEVGSHHRAQRGGPGPAGRGAGAEPARHVVPVAGAMGTPERPAGAGTMTVARRKGETP